MYYQLSRCWSYLGSRGGRQTVSLQSPDCLRIGVISHEFMHALGFVHEQSRFDRDKYVTVMWPNIWRGNFKGGTGGTGGRRFSSPFLFHRKMSSDLYCIQITNTQRNALHYFTLSNRSIEEF